MSPLFNEDTLVQQTTAEYLENQLGWESVYAYNQEDYGTDSLLGRKNDREVVLTRYLRQALKANNPDLPEQVYDQAVREIVSISASENAVKTNEEKYDLIRNGVPVTYTDDKGERITKRLTVINFESPTKNHFLCVREFWVKGDLYRRRADIVGFVNGLPLLFMELKNVSKDIRAGYERNLSDYKDTIPHLFHHNAWIVLANGTDAKVGALTSRFEHFLEWKRLQEDEPGVVDMETLLKGVCQKETLIDLFENFIIFDTSGGDTVKIIGRNHQYLGVNRAIEALKNREDTQGRLGVFWHTQGAGKSYSMVFFTRKVHRKLGGNFTFLILTDRDDLDTQIYKTYAGCGVVNHDQTPCRATSGNNLNDLLTQHSRYVFSLIQKFNKEVDPESPYTQRNDVIVISDEAHRTQYGTLALNMRNALPKASFIGFTGTPLFSDDEITKRVFGDYVSTYDFKRAVEDKATVPLYYDARGEKLGVVIGDLNERISEKLEELEKEDIDVEQRLEQELKRDYHIITAHKRLDQVAKDFVSHYTTAWESGKAMLVCIDKVTCVKMYNLLTTYWQQHIKKEESDLTVTHDEQEAQVIKRKIEWMKETRMAVVVSEEQGEVEKFNNWDLDIKPHRRLIKDGMDLPVSMRQKPQFNNKQNMSLEDAFKEKEHPFRVVIVCAMWLTGFDVPSLSTLYLDKPLKAHTLMQAIARANRVAEGKNNGLVVDYCGILKHLRKALATFAGAGDQGRGGQQDGTDPTDPEDDLLDELDEAITLVKTFLQEKNASLEAILNSTGFERNAAILGAKEAANENDETRKRFEIMCREVFRKFKACLNHEKINGYRASHDAISIIYKSLQKDKEKADISDIIRELHRIVDEAIEINEDNRNTNTLPYDISKIDFDRLKKEFEKSPAKNTTVQSLKDSVENRLRRLLQQNPLRTDFQHHYEEIVHQYNQEKDRVTIEQTFEALLRFTEALSQEEERALQEGLDEESLAIFDLLKKDEINAKDIKKIKSIAVELLKTLKETKLQIEGWRERESSRDAVHTTILNFLYSDETGLPLKSYSEEEVKGKTEEIYQHVFRVYPQLPSPYYDRDQVA